MRYMQEVLHAKRFVENKDGYHYQKIVDVICESDNWVEINS